MRFLSAPLNTTHFNLNMDHVDLDLDVPEPYSWTVLLVTVAVGVVVFTVFGNTLTIFALFRIKPSASQNSVSNLYIASLAAADLVVGVFVMPFMIMYSVASDFEWPLGQHFCDTWQAVDFISCTISLYSICAIGFDRWWNLEKPLRIFSRNRVIAVKLIAGIWLAPVLIWVPTLISLRHANGWPKPGSCDFEWRPQFLVPVIAIPVLYVPVLVLIGLFFRITFVIRSHMKFLHKYSNRSSCVENSRNESCRLIESPFLRKSSQMRIISHGNTPVLGLKGRKLLASNDSLQPCPVELCSPGSVRLISAQNIRENANRLHSPTAQNGSSMKMMKEKLAPLKEVSIAVSGPSTTLQRSRSPSETDPFLLRPQNNGCIRKFSATIERSETSSGSENPIWKTPEEQSPSGDEKNDSASNRSRESGSSTMRYRKKKKRTSIISDTAVVFSNSKTRVLEAKPPLLRARTENLLEIRTEIIAERRRSARFSIVSIREGLLNSKRMSINLFSELIPATGISQQIRAAKAVGLLLICFLICWLPFLICWPLKVYCPDCVSNTGYSISIWANLINSTLNPILYTLCSPRVQRTLKQQWKRCRKRSDNDKKIRYNNRRFR